MSDWLEATFSTLRPRALAALTRYFQDVEIAEEAFSEACLKAVTEWSGAAVPRDPMAWILAVARNSGIDGLRKAKRRQDILTSALPEADIPDIQISHDPDEVRDDVLRLLFICCHPALGRQDQIALALRVVGGLTVEEIARAFLVKAKTMEQRLTRARKRVGAQRIAFETPSPQERGKRLGEVSLMIYLMFNEGWSSSDSATQMRIRLCEEAIRLARLLADLFPGMGEQAAMLSLFLFQHARRAARQDASGNLISLTDQDRSLWDEHAIAEALVMLQKADRIGQRGPYRIQAAIAAEHAKAQKASETKWHIVEAHYAALYALQPTPVVRLNHIATLAKTKGPEFALTLLEELAADLEGYRWFHTMKAGLLDETGDVVGACLSYQTALSLGPTQPERAVIIKKIASCKKTSPECRNSSI